MAGLDPQHQQKEAVQTLCRETPYSVLDPTWDVVDHCRDLVSKKDVQKSLAVHVHRSRH